MAIINTRTIYNFNAVDESLDARVTTLENAVGGIDIPSLEASIAAEAAARQEADTTLKTDVTAEYTAAIATAKSTVEAGYAAADAALKQEIVSEYGASVADLQTALNTEVSTRQTADADLQTAVDTEIADRQAAIASEVVNRNNAITAAIDEYHTANQQRLDALQAQIDNAITTWFGNEVPTAENFPASEWTDDDTKNIHLGDVYYDNRTGYAYRYRLADGVYSWELIKDSDITKAIADAAAAQATADTKQDANVGVAAAGHLLAVDDDGNITTVPPKGLLISSETGNKMFYLTVTDDKQLQLSEVL